MSPNETMKPDSEWGFTATPDFPRICRELEQTGAVVGRVAMKGETPVTLIDTRTAKVPGGHASRSVVGAPAHWRVVAGSCEKAALGIRPVTVRAWNKVPVFTTPGVLPDPPCNPAERTKLDQLARFERLAEGNLDTLWTTGDGSKVRVSAMSDSPLFFALAKAFRGEYYVSADRQKGIEALKLEAARRLLKLRVLTRPDAAIGTVVSYDPAKSACVIDLKVSPRPVVTAPEYSDDPVAIPGRWAVVYRESTGARQLCRSAYAFHYGYASKPEAEMARDRIQRDRGHSTTIYTVLAPKRPPVAASQTALDILLGTGRARVPAAPPTQDYSDHALARSGRWSIVFNGRADGQPVYSVFDRHGGFATRAEAESIRSGLNSGHVVVAPRRPMRPLY